MNGTLAWDISGKFDPHHCLDISPETLYDKGKDVEDPFKRIKSA